MKQALKLIANQKVRLSDSLSGYLIDLGNGNYSVKGKLFNVNDVKAIHFVKGFEPKLDVVTAEDRLK